MKIMTVDSVKELVGMHGLNRMLLDLIDALRRDFSRWETFTKMPRPAMHVPGGVLELMPICDNEKYYTFKYVNCHPKNPSIGQQTVVATGQLSRIDTGYPLMYSEMTVLTALRTAATSALVTDLLSREDSHILSIIGCGAQSEFQARAVQLIRDIREIRFFDIDPDAMNKFEMNMSSSSCELVRCQSAEKAVRGADIVTVCTAAKAHVDVLKNEWIRPGMHINGMGGDCPGKTELEATILPRCKLVVEYFEQSLVEGEIQRLTKEEAKRMVYAELHEMIKGKKMGRVDTNEITLFDSVGIALEDYAVLRLTYELAEQYGIGEDLSLTPNISNPKNLFSLVSRPKHQEKNLALGVI